MAKYVDGFLIPLPKKNIAAYRRMATTASRIWRKHGALEYRECVGDDLKPKGVVSMLKSSKANSGDTVVFAWVVYKSRAHRDQVNKKIMKDPRMLAMMADMKKNPKKVPFDMRRMAYGGFKILMDA
jgi:uncharacterized protein YbaA (DUF1428 family)